MVEGPEEVGHVGCMQTKTPPIDHRSPPPEPDPCLCRAYESRPKPPKGGTLIAEAVMDLETHERMLARDAYRPPGCSRCGAEVHAHEHRPRLLLGLQEDPGRVTQVAIYRCADRENCGAVWRILPGLLARHLWRAWTTVEQAVAEQRAPPAEPVETITTVPASTRQRWRMRLATSAALVVAALATAADVREHAAVVERAGYQATRRELVIIFNDQVDNARAEQTREQLSPLATVVHRLAPGVRLM